MKHYLIYQVRNKLNGIIYIGQHQTENVNDGYMGSGPRIRRAIEKYGLDIDFTKLDYVEIEVHSDEYIGGIDENGHERMDNYNEVVNSISFYAAHDNSRLLIYDEANNLYEDTVELSEALERISEYLDLSRNSTDMK